MKNTIILLLLCLGWAVHAQSPEQVVASYIQAIGGKENLKKVKTITADIEVVSNGLAMDGRIAYSFPDKQYTEMIVRGEKIITVVNGDKGWMVNPMTGSSNAFPMSEQQIQSTRRSPSADHLLDPSGYSLEDLGERQVKGKNYRVLKVIFSGGTQSRQNRYFNPETKLIDYVEMDSPAGGSILMAYKEYTEVNGMRFPGLILSYTGSDMDSPSMSMRMKNMKVNAPVDAGLFEKP
ncbi:LolA family protein [Robertkochia flava]|uniref:LolA family protein n=1 Tax=Robertkochia flava TaxID=3447986 RepID=UPI001CCC468B|nr:hypothetical protein [Robertkochia marina]